MPTLKALSDALFARLLLPPSAITIVAKIILRVKPVLERSEGMECENKNAATIATGLEPAISRRVKENNCNSK